MNDCTLATPAHHQQKQQRQQHGYGYFKTHTLLLSRCGEDGLVLIRPAYEVHIHIVSNKSRRIHTQTHM